MATLRGKEVVGQPVFGSVDAFPETISDLPNLPTILHILVANMIENVSTGSEVR